MFLDSWFDDMSRVSRFKMSKNDNDFGLADTLTTTRKFKMPKTNASFFDDRYIDNEMAKFKNHNDFLFDVEDYEKKYMPLIDFSYTDPKLYQYNLKGKTLNDLVMDKVKGIDPKADEESKRQGQGDRQLGLQRVLQQVKWNMNKPKSEEEGEGDGDTVKEEKEGKEGKAERKKKDSGSGIKIKQAIHKEEEAEVKQGDDKAEAVEDETEKNKEVFENDLKQNLVFLDEIQMSQIKDQMDYLHDYMHQGVEKFSNSPKHLKQISIAMVRVSK